MSALGYKRSVDPGRPSVRFAPNATIRPRSAQFPLRSHKRSFQAHFADGLEGWGKALYYAGKMDEAHNQFATAAQLGLMEADKAELAGMSQG